MRKEIRGGYLDYRLPDMLEAIRLARFLDLKNITGREDEVLEKFLEVFESYVTEVNFEDKKTYKDVLKDLSLFTTMGEVLKDFFDAMNTSEKKKEILPS